MWSAARLGLANASRVSATAFAFSIAVHPRAAHAEGPATTSTEVAPMASRMADFIKSTQAHIVSTIERVDGHAKFKVDRWERNDGTGSHGISCVMQEGKVFEKAGVMVSVLNGVLPKAAVAQMRGRGHELDEGKDLPYIATGISLVIHPQNPHAPTVHLNYRYFEVQTSKGPVAWFGGGADLTPSYIYDEDVTHFHKQLKWACDRHSASFYPAFKKNADEYFYSPHRKERRGVGGIFFDDMESPNLETVFQFVQDAASSFLPSYLPLIRRRKDTPFTAEEKEWQQLRRGRYVEFNLVHDRGTKFGLANSGRTESILVSLPLTARWEYEHKTAPGSREAYAESVFAQPREWA